MTQTWALLLLFIVAMAALPWWIKRWQQRSGGATGAAQSRVLSAVAVGPQQRVVTIEVGHGNERAVLVLGVTAQQVNCLHVLASGAAPAAATTTTPAPAATADFARELAALPQTQPGMQDKPGAGHA